MKVFLFVLLQTIQEELEACQNDMEQVHEVGEELFNLVGEAEKPEVEKNVEDLDSNWTEVNSAWADRQKALGEALNKATTFQDELMKTLNWLSNMEDKLVSMGPIGTDTDVVKDQLIALKVSKARNSVAQIPHYISIVGL